MVAWKWFAVFWVRLLVVPINRRRKRLSKITWIRGAAVCVAPGRPMNASVGLWGQLRTSLGGVFAAAGLG